MNHPPRYGLIPSPSLDIRDHVQMPPLSVWCLGLRLSRPALHCLITSDSVQGTGLDRWFEIDRHPLRFGGFQVSEGTLCRVHRMIFKISRRECRAQEAVLSLATSPDLENFWHPPSLRRTAFIWSADDLDPDLQILGFQGMLAPNSRFFVFLFLETPGPTRARISVPWLS